MGRQPVLGIRVATAARSGGGHLARCRAIGAAYGSVRMFTDPHVPGVPPVGGDSCAEASEGHVDRALAALCTGEVQAVLLDSYHVKEPARQALAQAGPLIEMLDEGRPALGQMAIHPSVQTLPAETFGLPVERVVSGPSYLCLGARFSSAHGGPHRAIAPGRVEHAVVCLGARDGANAIPTVVAALAASPAVERLTVVLGSIAAHRDAAEAAVRAAGARARLRIDVEDMAALFADSDFAVTAAGVTLLEAACSGAPTACLTVAANQRANAEAAAGLKIAASLGAFPPEDSAGLTRAMADLVLDGAARTLLRQRALAAIDGRGGARVAAHIRRVLAAL